MTDSVRPDIFCRYEGEEFPASEFRTDPDWGRVHEVEDGPRHTYLGDEIDGDEWVLKSLGGA